MSLHPLDEGRAVFLLFPIRGQKNVCGRVPLEMTSLEQDGGASGGCQALACCPHFIERCGMESGQDAELIQVRSDERRQGKEMLFVGSEGISFQQGIPA